MTKQTFEEDLNHSKNNRSSLLLELNSQKVVYNKYLLERLSCCIFHPIKFYLFNTSCINIAIITPIRPYAEKIQDPEAPDVPEETGCGG